jgi:hypothetical protein
MNSTSRAAAAVLCLVVLVLSLACFVQCQNGQSGNSGSGSQIVTQIVNANGNQVDANGNPVNANGNPVNANGITVDANGNPVDANGNPIDPNAGSSNPSPSDTGPVVIDIPATGSGGSDPSASAAQPIVPSDLNVGAAGAVPGSDPSTNPNDPANGLFNITAPVSDPSPNNSTDGNLSDAGNGVAVGRANPTGTNTVFVPVATGGNAGSPADGSQQASSAHVMASVLGGSPLVLLVTSALSVLAIVML